MVKACLKCHQLDLQRNPEALHPGGPEPYKPQALNLLALGPRAQEYNPLVQMDDIMEADRSSLDLKVRFCRGL